VKTKILTCTILCFSAFTSSFAGGLSHANVDAVTAATVNNECTFNLPVAVTSTSATVQWTEQRKGGSASFCYGIVNPPSPCRAVSSTERTLKTIQLTGLTPETTYYIYIEMSISGENPYAASGSFTTAAATGITAPVPAKRESVFYRAGNTIVFGNGIVSGDKIVGSDISGRILFSVAVSAGASSVQIPRNAAGMCLVQVMRDGTILATIPFVTMTR
jgi:hypothetical protein